MNKKITALVLLFAMIFSYSVMAQKEPEEKKASGLFASSPHAIVADLKTGAVLYEKNADDTVYPAGLTKIMTALLTIENCNIEELVTAGETALSNVKPGDSKLGIIKGEKLSVRQLLYAMMLSAANDATNVLAEKVGGSAEDFVALMNKRAKELGMENTHFTNPTGEHDERHQTTARDMAKLACVAMQMEDLREIVKSDSYNIPPTGKSNNARKVTNRNHFVSRLLRNDYFYKNATGLCTGYTVEAKSCIAATAQKNSMELLALVFEAETVDNVAQSYSDCTNMFNHIFENYTVEKIASGGDLLAQTGIVNTRRQKKLILKAEKDVQIIREKETGEADVTYKDFLPEKVNAPVKENQIIGEREFFLNGVSIGRLNLLSDKDYNLDPITFVMNKMIAFFTSPWLFVAIAIVIFVLIMAERRRRRILRKKRRDARNKRNKELMKEIKG